MTPMIAEPNTTSAALTLRSTLSRHDKVRILHRLRRMEGQVRGVHGMIVADAPCHEVLTQLSAVIAAARQTGLLVLEDHLRDCLLGTEQSAPAKPEETLTEVNEVIDRFVRTVG